MLTGASPIDRIVHDADGLRSALIDAADSVHPQNLASDGTTTVQGALAGLRAVIDAFLSRDDPDNAITGEQSTE